MRKELKNKPLKMVKINSVNKELIDLWERQAKTDLHDEKGLINYGEKGVNVSECKEKLA